MHMGLTLAMSARKYPQHEAVICESRRRTYADLNANANALAHSLAERGVGKGDKVAIMLFNSDWFTIAYFAVMKAGALAVPVGTRLAPPEVAYILGHSDSVAMIFDQAFAPLVRTIRGELPGVRLWIQVGGDPADDVPSMNALLAEGSRDEPDVKIDEWDDAEIIYTSGTTGRPKGAVFTHHALLSTSIQIGLHEAVLGITHQDRILNVAPLYHVGQLHLYHNPGVWAGATHVMLKKFEPAEVLATLERERITQMFGAPTMFLELLYAPDFQRHDLNALRKAFYGGAPMNAEHVRLLMGKFPRHTRFFNLCGFTEAGPSGIFLGPEDQIRKAGTAGNITGIYNEVRVVDDDFNDVAPGSGQVGELVVRGDSCMREYYKNPEATAEAVVDGWVRSGDLAVVDEEGFITLVDRKKDMIISGGMNIYSREVETVIAEHPKVKDVAVVGVPNDLWGETVLAVVVPKPGERPTGQEIAAWCEGRIAHFKVPRLFEFVDALPVNAAGKVLKRELRERYKNLAAPSTEREDS